MTNQKSLIDDAVEWAELVIMELRIDSARGEWDRLDKLEDAIAALKAAAVEPSVTPCAMCADGIGREFGYHEVDGEQIECPAVNRPEAHE